LRGVSTLTAFAPAVEIGDWTRLDGRRIGSYLGLVPIENSSGPSRFQGALTRTGNAHARRLLVEAAWNHRTSYTPTSPSLRARWALASLAARERGHQGFAAPPPLAGVRGARQTQRRRQRRRCPRARRMVLVLGGDGVMIRPA
jgi:transposase